MSDADSAASEAARRLSEQRWGNTVLSRAVATVVERADRLDTDQVDALAWVVEQRKETDGG
jgi:hypothetical protein